MRLLVSILIVVTILIVLFGVSTRWKPNMAKYKPHDFFQDDALPIGNAIAADDLNTLQSLCSADGVELNQVHLKDMTFLHFALMLQHDQAMKVLVKCGASPHIEIEGIGSVMYAAIRAEDTKFLQALLEGGVDPNSTDKHEMPLFFQAATKDDLTALELLIKHGANLNLTSKSGRPVALHAFTGLKYDQVEFLIKQGVDLNLANRQGITLAYAVEHELKMQNVNRQTDAYSKLVHLQNLMVERGVKFPAPAPATLKQD